MEREQESNSNIWIGKIFERDIHFPDGNRTGVANDHIDVRKTLYQDEDRYTVTHRKNYNDGSGTTRYNIITTLAPIRISERKEKIIRDVKKLPEFLKNWEMITDLYATLPLNEALKHCREYAENLKIALYVDRERGKTIEWVPAGWMPIIR